MTIFQLAYDLQTLMDDRPEMAEVPVSVLIQGFEDTRTVELSLPAEFRIKRIRVARSGVSLVAENEFFPGEA